MALIPILIPGTTSEVRFVDAATLSLGSGGSTPTPTPVASRQFTSAVSGDSFTVPGTFADLQQVDARNADNSENDQVELSVGSSTNGQTTFVFNQPAGLDPFTGVIKFIPR